MPGIVLKKQVVIGQLLVGLMLAILALPIGCKSNKDIFSGLSSSADDDGAKDGIDVITITENSNPVTGKGNDMSMPDGFSVISKEDFLTQVSDSERSVYALDKDNLYDYYRLTIDDKGGMRCTQYLAMGKRVWGKLKRLAVSVEKNRVGYSFKVFKTSDNLVAQTAEVARIKINFYCNTNDNNDLKNHRVMVAYESSQGMNPHMSGNDIVTDMKIPLVYPRFEALRGDMKNGELRLRDIAFLDANAYYQDHNNSVPAAAIAP